MVPPMEFRVKGYPQKLTSSTEFIVNRGDTILNYSSIKYGVPVIPFDKIIYCPLTATSY
jgi:hypothetical protein